MAASIVALRRGDLTVQEIYQAEMYKELFGATFGFLAGTDPTPEELWVQKSGLTCAWRRM
jgi:hypothetical protein